MKFPWTKGKYDTLQCHNKKYMYMYILAWKLRSLISRWLARRMFPVDLFCFTLPMNIHRLALSALILTWMFWKFLYMDIAVWPFFHPLNVWFSCWKSFFIFKGYIKVSEFIQLCSSIQYVVCPSQWFLQGYLIENPLCIIMMRGFFWPRLRRTIDMRYKNCCCVQ